MSRKKKKGKPAQRAAKPGWWASLGARMHARLVRRVWLSVLAASTLLAGSVALGKLETHVDAILLRDRPDASVTLENLPAEIAGLAEADIRNQLADFLDRNWTDNHLCRDMARRLGKSPWVRRVEHVRRTSAAVFQIRCDYRLPVAIVQQGSDFLLVDRFAVLLPGVYRYDPGWKLIQGVGAAAPGAGQGWAGADLSAALDILAAIEAEPFSDQITAVLVDNFDGRRDARASHIELATDQAGGRIRWGSAPGRELVENGVEQKLAILRENYHRTGRADAHHPVIDVATFPDRFTIPG